MAELYIGIELGDEFSTVAWLDRDSSKIHIVKENDKDRIPSMISLNTATGSWCAGAAAQNEQGVNGRIVLHRLVGLLRSGKRLVVGSTEYTAPRMMSYYLEYLIELTRKSTGIEKIASVAICMDFPSLKESEQLYRIMKNIGVDNDQIHILNRQEAMVYFLTSQSKELWNNTSFVFDYEEGRVDCYEMRLVKGMNPVTVSISQERFADSPSLYQITEAKEHVDEWLCDMAENKLDKKITSSVLLSGAGFVEDIRWAERFVGAIRKHKVKKIYQTPNISSNGAAFAAYHMSDDHKHYPYHMVCEGRVSTKVSMTLSNHGNKEYVTLIPESINCFEARVSLDLNVIGETRLILKLNTIGVPTERQLIFDLTGFLDGGKERTRVNLSLVFLKSSVCAVRIEDLGFGEIYPATGRTIERVINILEE